MNVKQVYNILNDVVKSAMGDGAFNIQDTKDIVSLGNEVLSSSTNTDNFLNTLVDRIGRTIVSTRAYSANVKALINDSFTFGAILQKIYVAPIKASENKQWGLIDGQSVDQYVIAKPTVKQKLFNKVSTWEIDVTIPDNTLKSAFTSAESMSAFIDAVFTAVRNSMEQCMESLANLTYATACAMRVVDTKVNGGITAIDLLSAYNSMAGVSLTVDTALHSTDFVKFATRLINLTIKRMGEMTTRYNSEGYARFTPVERMRVIMLADFETSIASYLQADTFHDEYLAIPKHSTVLMWQGNGQGMDFANASKISIKTPTGYTVTQGNIVCMLADEEAIGLTYDNQRNRSARNEKGEYTNYFFKADMGYFFDASENLVIFTIGSLATPTESSVDPVDVEFSLSAKADKVFTVTLKNSETVSAVKKGSTTLTASTDYTESSGVITIDKTSTAIYSGASAGDVITLSIVLSSGAVLEVNINVVE